MHCFVDDMETAVRAMGLGFYISFSGIVTFRNANALREVAMQVPLDRILIETDAPYLAPVPHRGRQNRPAYVRHVAEHLAELRGMPLEEIARIKQPDLTAGDLENAVRTIAGTARSMGIETEGV